MEGTSKNISLDVSKIAYFDCCSVVWAILAEVSDKPQQLNGHNWAAKITIFSNYKVRSSFLNDFGLERLERRRIKKLAEVMCDIYNYRTWNDRVVLICQVFIHIISEILCPIGSFLEQKLMLQKKASITGDRYLMKQII